MLHLLEMMFNVKSDSYVVKNTFGHISVFSSLNCHSWITNQVLSISLQVTNTITSESMVLPEDRTSDPCITNPMLSLMS